MTRKIMLAICAALCASSIALAFQTKVPAGSGIVAIGVHPEPRNDPRPLVAHFPLQNFLSFEIDFSTPAMALTFDKGTATFYDQDGVPYRQETFGVNDFDTFSSRFNANPAGSGANIPMGERIVFFFPFEELGPNEMPSTIDVSFCFAEFAGPNGECSDPLVFQDITLQEYHAPPGQTYIYPTGTPAEMGEEWYSGGGHELLSPNGHRRGGLRFNGNTSWVNQRYAYDIAVKQGGLNGPECDDGNGGSGNACNQNGHYFCWGEPILAPADGEIVLLTQGNPDNPEPRCEGRQDCSQCSSYNPATPALCPLAPGAGLCNNQPDAGLCGATYPCPPGDFPGSGNQVVLLHDSGEYTTFAHMQQGSNNHLVCGQRVNQGDLLGWMGMSGSGSNPHMHFSSLTTPGPEAQIAENTPMYFNNIEFITAGQTKPRRQLDVSLPSETLINRILMPPQPLSRNAPQPPGIASEQEPNDVLADHTALTYPSSASGTLEAADVGDLAVRGDGIEDIFRIDVSQADSVRVDLDWVTPGQNLDVYALTENLRVLNDTWQGTQAVGPERVCLELDPGAYYLMVTNADQAPSQDVNYYLDVVSDPQTIGVTLAGGADIVEVDASCQATVEFAIQLHDNCCLDEDNLNLEVIATNPTGNATVGPVQLDPPQVQSETDILVTGRVAVSNLLSCPAELRIEAAVEDCQGNRVETTVTGGGDSVDLIDATPPVVTSSVGVPRLWAASHDLVDVGFVVSVVDNCDAGVESTLGTVIFADETEVPETGDGTGRHAPDAKDPDGTMRLRSERRGGGDGRVYLITSRAVDSCGNAAFTCGSAGVAHDQTADSEAALAAQEAAALAFCASNDGASPAGFSQHGLSLEIGPKQ